MDRNLIKYLPYEVRKYKDYQEITNAENPEFTKLFNISKEILDESFIESSTEYGVSRLEKILGIFPNSYDTLEDRKLRLITWWNNQIPYTWRVLIEKLNAICGVGNYDIKLLNDVYQIVLKTKLNTSSQYEELLFLFERIISANIEILSSNTLSNRYEKKLYYGVALGEVKTFGITNDINIDSRNTDIFHFGSAISEYKNQLISNDLKVDYSSDNLISLGYGISEYKAIKIKTEELI